MFAVHTGTLVADLLVMAAVIFLGGIELSRADAVQALIAQEEIIQRQLQAGNLTQAEQTFLKMAQIAERLLRNNPMMYAAADADDIAFYFDLEQFEEAAG